MHIKIKLFSKKFSCIQERCGRGRGKGSCGEINDGKKIQYMSLKLTDLFHSENFDFVFIMIMMIMIMIIIIIIIIITITIIMTVTKVMYTI